MNTKNPHAKSCIRVYNNEIVKVSDPVVVIDLMGEAQTDCGCSLTLKKDHIQVNTPGLYHFSADVEFSGKTDSVIQLYVDGQSIPSAVASIPSCSSSGLVHIETELCIRTCRMNHPKVYLEASDVTEISKVNLGALKLA